MMSVVHVSVSDIRGGAAKAAFRLHEGLRKAGVSSSMVVAEKYSESEFVTVPVRDKIGYYERRLTYRQLAARFWLYAPTRPSGLDLFTDPRVRRNRRLYNKLPHADVTNLHWISHFVDLPTFLSRSQVPVVWTLHDMNAFTGGCHYTLGCEKYQQQCGACPQLGSATSNDISRKIWLVKQEIYRQMANGKLHIVAPSNWLAGAAQRSPLLHSMPISVIPNAVNTSVFRPYDRIEARSKLGIPLSPKIILFSADSIVSQRKGLRFLLPALQAQDRSSDILLVSLGAGKINNAWNTPTFSLGYVADEHQIALAYSAADLFVVPSIEDNLPNTVMEAMACGIPVIGFDVGGIADMVRSGISGQLVPAKDIRQLSEAISALLGNDPIRIEMAANSRRIALSEYGLQFQAEAYINLYHTLIHSEESRC